MSEDGGGGSDIALEVDPTGEDEDWADIRENVESEPSSSSGSEGEEGPKEVSNPLDPPVAQPAGLFIDL